MGQESVKRKFYFYSIEAGYVNQTNTIIQYQNIAEPFYKLFCDIQKLKYSNKDYTINYLLYQNMDGNYIYIHVDNISKEKIEFKLMLCRDKLLPFIEEDGKLKPISELFTNKKQKLAEVTHCVLYLEKNILGMEYNFAGAKTKNLIIYLEAKAKYGKVVNIKIDNLINEETLEKLQNNGEMSLLHIKVISGSKAIKQLIDADNAFNSLNITTGNIDFVELALRRGITKKKPGFIIEGLTQNVLKEIFKQNKPDFDTFSVKYGRGSDIIDLLNENFVCKSEFMPISSTKIIEDADAYNVMNEYYNHEILDYFS